MAVLWRDTRGVHMLTSMHCPPVEGNFCDECENVIKPDIIEQYQHHMGYVGNGNRMADSFLSNAVRGSR
jgi:hypothetical protein